MTMRRDVLSIFATVALACVAVSAAGGDRAVAQPTADPAEKIAVGDVLQVAIFESPFYSLRPGNFVTLPSQTVDCDGTISVPFAGQIHAAGRTLVEIRREIEAQLAKRVVEPLITVTLHESGRPILGGCRPLIETNG